MEQDPVVLAFPPNDQDRLRLAMRRLEVALADQAEAVRDFRASLAELRQATTGLEASVGSYRTTLDETAAEVRKAHRAALELRDTAGKLERLG